MKTNVMRRRIITATSVILLAAALVTAGLFYRHNKALKTTVQTEKIKSEALLSEKLQLKKLLDELNTTVYQLKESNSGLEAQLQEKIKFLEQKEAEVYQLLSENASLKQLRQKIAELKQVREELLSELAGIKQKMESLRSENGDLSHQLAQERSANESLKTQLANIPANNNQLLSTILTNNCRMEAVKGKNAQLTLTARRTSKLVVSFDLPYNVDKELHFTVITPSGQEVSCLDSDDIMDIRTTDILYVSLDNASCQEKTVIRRVEMTYKPTTRLTKGIYQFDIFSKNNYIGSTQIRLK
jgi:peptidoglycan hydrolase CwlO-like protein